MPAPALFDLPYSPEWGYERSFFLDNEHRYTKMHRLLRERYGDLAGRRVLDLGCSRGQFLERFRRYPDVELTGTEIDPAEIEHSERRGISVERAYVEPATPRLPFEDASFDVVLAGEIIEHIVDTERFLREILRVLAAGGAAVLSTPNILWWKHRLRLLLGGYPDALDYRLRWGRDYGHVRIFTPSLLRGLLEEVGFEDIRVAGKRLGPIASLSRTPAPVAHKLDALADRLPDWSDHVVAVARKPVDG